MRVIMTKRNVCFLNLIFLQRYSVMYLISRDCEGDHLLKFIEGHPTSRIKRAFRPQLQLFRIHFSKGDCLYFKSDLS